MNYLSVSFGKTFVSQGPRDNLAELGSYVERLAHYEAETDVWGDKGALLLDEARRNGVDMGILRRLVRLRNSQGRGDDTDFRRLYREAVSVGLHETWF